MGNKAARESKYRILQRSDGFAIDAQDRNRVEVEIRSTHFHVSDGILEQEYPQETVGLFEYRKLLDLIAWGLMRGWEPPIQDREPWPGIKSWAVGKTRRAISRLVYPQWRRLISQADERIVGVQKSIFAATFGCAEITLNPEFYRHRFLVRDVIKYRAAAAAVRHAESLTQLKQWHQNQPAGQEIQNRSTVIKSIRHLRLIMNDEQDGGDGHDGRDGGVSEATQITYLQRWLDLFSAGPAYKSLRRTLMNLPGGVASRLLVDLPGVHLERPVVRRLELMVLLLASRYSNQVNQRVFQFADQMQIRAAIKIVGRSEGCRLSTRSIRDVEWFVNRVARFPDRHNGNIVGLAEKTVRWQRDLNAARLRSLIDEYGRNSRVQPPPIDFPDAPEIRFLATPAEICAEGIQMHHCIEMMIPDAVDGRAYLFHADKFDCSATILVDAKGEYCQASGPFNQSNRACRWAVRVLRRWSRALGPLEPNPQLEVD